MIIPHRSLTLALALVLVLLLMDAAFAQTSSTTSSSTFDVSWSALDPGHDWTWQMLQSVFPVNGTPPTNTGTAATLIGTLLGQITGLVMALAMFFLCYLTIINIHRVSESAEILTSAMTSMAAVRIGFAAIMMFPLSSGFSVGQAGVMQVAGWGIGMARTLYANAVKAIGPDAMVIADPIIPGARTIVLGLIEDELCRSLINQATATTLVPAPTASVVNSGKGAVVTYAYSLASGNGTGSPTCGSVSVANSSAAPATLGGVTIDMATQQRSILEGIISTLRPQIELDRPVLLAEQDSRCAVAASEPLSDRDPELYAAADQRCSSDHLAIALEPELDRRPQRQSGPQQERSAAVDPRLDFGRGLLPWLRPSQRPHALARERNADRQYAELRGPVAVARGRHRAPLHLLELIARQAQNLCLNRRRPDLAGRQRRHPDRHVHGHGWRRHDGEAVPGAELHPDAPPELRRQSLPDRPELGRSLRRPDRAWQSDDPRRHDGARSRRHRLHHHRNGCHHPVQRPHDELGGGRRHPQPQRADAILRDADLHRLHGLADPWSDDRLRPADDTHGSCGSPASPAT